MGTPSLQFKFYAAEARDPRADFIRVIGMLSKMTSIRSGWTHYAVHDRFMSILDRDSPYSQGMSAEEVADRAGSLAGCVPSEFSASTSVESGSPTNSERPDSDSYFVMDVITHSTYTPKAYEYPRVAFATLRMRPLDRFLSHPISNPELQEPLTDMVLYLLANSVSALSPFSVHAYNLDSSAGWPINSYVSYFSSPRACLEEILLTLAFWTQLKPQLASTPHLISRDEWLSSGRTPAEQDLLQSRLDNYSSVPVALIESDVAAVCASHRFDVVDRPQSGWCDFTVLEYPYFLSKQLDDFLFAILDQSRLRASCATPDESGGVP